jgi:hypothetical protein
MTVSWILLWLTLNLIFDEKNRFKSDRFSTDRQILCGSTLLKPPFQCKLCVVKSKWTHELFQLFSVRNVERYKRESACVFLNGSGQAGVKSEWVGTTWFRRLLEKDSCFELEQVRSHQHSYICLHLTLSLHNKQNSKNIYSPVTFFPLGSRFFLVWCNLIYSYKIHACIPFARAQTDTHARAFHTHTHVTNTTFQLSWTQR